MRYIFYFIIFSFVKIFELIWYFKIDTYPFKEFIKDIDNYEYPIDY